MTMRAGNYWTRAEEASEEKIDQIARWALDNKKYAAVEGKYTPGAYAILGDADQLLYAVAQILDNGRDDPQVRDVCITAIGASISDPEIQANVEKTMRAVVDRVIELEEAEDAT